MTVQKPKEMLWYDDDSRRPLTQKIARGVEHMRKRYGCTPGACYVHPSALEGLEGNPPVVTVEDVVVKLVPQRRVLRHHFAFAFPDQVRCVEEA
jgi:hypothetical protein